MESGDPRLNTWGQMTLYTSLKSCLVSGEMARGAQLFRVAQSHRGQFARMPEGSPQLLGHLYRQSGSLYSRLLLAISLSPLLQVTVCFQH